MKVSIENNELIIRVSVEYLRNSAECALTTGTEKVVLDEQLMLEYYQREINSLENDSCFNHCIDQIAHHAFEQGECWIDSVIELQSSL